MISDIVRAIIQRIFRDKILMGLLIIGFLSVFMMGANSNKEPAIKSPEQIHAQNEEHHSPQGQTAHQAPTPSKQAPHQAQNHDNNLQAQAEPSNNQVKPHEAEEFVKWWTTLSMDYQMETAEKNREQALGWMTEEAANSFKATFWTPELKQGVTQGTIVAGFQPVAVQATAINPDGSIVVHVKGSLAMQINGQPPRTEHLLTDYLVLKEAEGYRIAGVHNKTYVQAQAHTQQYYY